MAEVVTVDFHVTSECNQECPYCWGPQDFEHPVDTRTAQAIIRKIASIGARRVVFTGGDPLLRPDIGTLIEYAASKGLEVALSTTGDELKRDFLVKYGASIDLVSLPLDGASEATSSRTKKEGHFDTIMNALSMLSEFPAIDVKVATPVTRKNLGDVPAIVVLLDHLAKQMSNKLFYNVFQAFPRAMGEVDWADLVVSSDDFAGLRTIVEALPHGFQINWLTHRTLDRLYMMIFPDGTLTVPSGPDFLNYGPFLDIENVRSTLEQTDFDAPKHERHSKGWGRKK